MNGMYGEYDGEYEIKEFHIVSGWSKALTNLILIKCNFIIQLTQLFLCRWSFR